MHRNPDPRNSRDRRPSSQSSTTSASEDNNCHPRIHCRLCKNQVSCRNTEEFDYHLSLIHYRDRLFEAIGSPPYSCSYCGFRPTAIDPDEEMVIHYGRDERLAIKYYQEECNSMPTVDIPKKLISPPPAAKPPMTTTTTMQCRICKQVITTEKLFHTHITQKHFWQELRKKMPKDPPFKCPHKDCQQLKQDTYELVMHYGIDHGVSKDLYNKQVIGGNNGHDENQGRNLKEVDLFAPAEVKSDTSKNPKIACTICKGKSFVNEKSLKYHVIMFHYFTELLKAKVIKCPECKMKFPAKNEFAKHFIDLHFEGYFKKLAGSSKQKRPESKRPLQKCLNDELPKKKPKFLEDVSKAREMKTVHGVKRVRPDNHDHAPKAKNNHHAIAGSSPINSSSGGGVSSARQRMIDRWKGTSIDSQKYEAEQLQKKLDELNEVHKEALANKAKDFERWISQKEKIIEVEGEKRLEVEVKLEEAKVEVADLKKQLEQAAKKISSLEEVVVEEHTRYVQVCQDKKDIEKKLASQELLGKELIDFQSYIEKMKSEGKEMKAELAKKNDEIQELQEGRDKDKIECDKSLTKVQKQLDMMKAKYDKAVEEKKEKMVHIKEITKLHKELENDQKNQIARLMKEKADMKKEELPNLENALTKKVKALETEKKDNESTIKLLESQRNALLDSLDRVQKIMQGFESVIKDKNEKIQDVTTKLEEAEINLEEALEKLNNSKKSDKESKEAQKHIRQLQSTLKDWENRQFSNVKLISGLEKEKAALENKLKDLSEQENHDAKTEITTLRETKDKFEQDLAKCQALLFSKTSELNTKKELLLNAQSKIKDLERELRVGKITNNADQDETEELRTTVSTLSDRYGKLLQEYQEYQSRTRVMLKAGTSNDDPKVVETLKQVAREAQTKLSKKEKEVERLRAQLDNQFKIQIKREPLEQVDTEERQIVLNIPNPCDIVDHDDEDESPLGRLMHEDVDPYAFHDVDIEGLNSPPFSDSETSSNMSKKKTTAARGKIVDVSDQYAEDDDDITCGICLCWDPPLPNVEEKTKTSYTTSWVGCDCGQWYHKQCTKRKRFTSAFSCKSVKRKCQAVAVQSKPSLDETPEAILP